MFRIRLIKIIASLGLLTFLSCVYAEDPNAFASQIADQKKMANEEIELIISQHIDHGLELYNNGQYEDALDEFNTVLDIQSDNKKAREYRLRCINAIAGKLPHQSSASESKTVKGRRIFTGKKIKTADPVARSYYKQGLAAFQKNKKDLAINKLQKSIAADPVYTPAKRLLAHIMSERNKDYINDQKVLWKERLNEVSKAWLPTGKANKVTIAEDERNNEIISDAKRKMIEASKQIIPEINFTQAHLRDVLQYLSKITGVNIILDERVFHSAPQINLDDADSEDASIVEQSGGVFSDTITISLTNIPLIEALRYILKVKGLKFRIDDYAIMVSTPEGIGDEEMETRYYHLSAGIGDFTEFKLNETMVNPGIKDEGGSFGGEDLEIEEKITIKDVLVSSGVPFPNGSSVFIDKRTGTLIVHNTPENLSMVEKILEIIDRSPFQVNIQAKFVRILQNDLEELGFEWLLNSPVRVGKSVQGQNKWQIDADSGDVAINNALDSTINGRAFGIDMPNFPATVADGGTGSSSILAFSGILTDPQFQVVMHALDKSGNSDLLSAPSVTTVNNQQAQIELVDEIIYPGEYDLTPPVTSESGTLVSYPLAIPGDFLTRDVGVILNVTPSVGSDRKTITLTLIPEVSELVGWRDFGANYRLPGETTVNPITGVAIVGDPLDVNVEMEQPIFRTSNVSTTVIVNDGETVVLGGLIEEKKITVHDKVPFVGDIPLIGRFFKHDYDQTQKMNLMIFVTAKLITADGDDLHAAVNK